MKFQNQSKSYALNRPPQFQNSFKIVAFLNHVTFFEGSFTLANWSNSRITGTLDHKSEAPGGEEKVGGIRLNHVLDLLRKEGYCVYIYDTIAVFTQTSLRYST